MWAILASLVFAADPIPLGDSASVSLWAHGRAQASVVQPALADVPPQGAGQFRLFGGVSFAWIDTLEFTVELASSTAIGEWLAPIDTDWLRVQRGYLRAHAGDVEVTLGRDIWNLGEGFLVSDRMLANVPRSFDGLRVQWARQDVSAQFLFGPEVDVQPGVMDNGWTGRTLWGSWWELGDRELLTTAYYLGTRDPLAVYNSGSGTEFRHTWGANVSAETSWA